MWIFVCRQPTELGDVSRCDAAGEEQEDFQGQLVEDTQTVEVEEEEKKRKARDRRHQSDFYCLFLFIITVLYLIHMIKLYNSKLCFNVDFITFQVATVLFCST